VQSELRKKGKLTAREKQRRKERSENLSRGTGKSNFSRDGGKSQYDHAYLNKKKGEWIEGGPYVEKNPFSYNIERKKKKYSVNVSIEKKPPCSLGVKDRFWIKEREGTPRYFSGRGEVFVQNCLMEKKILY